MCHSEGSGGANSFSTFSKRGVSSCAVFSYASPFSFCASGVSRFSPSAFSLGKVPLEFLLDSITADDKILPSELDREGFGVGGGDTRAEIIFREFIVQFKP
jgi:hypothetical protein